MTDLLVAWAAWDRHPASDSAAAKMEGACQEEAARLGVDATELRIVLSSAVRNGATRREALEKARALFS